MSKVVPERPDIQEKMRNLQKNRKKLMEKCFDVGEDDKKNRYTTSSCKRLMLEKLGERFVLSENQIAGFWSNYRKRKTCETV